MVSFDLLAEDEDDADGDRCKHHQGMRSLVGSSWKPLCLQPVHCSEMQDVEACPYNGDCHLDGSCVTGFAALP